LNQFKDEENISKGINHGMARNKINEAAKHITKVGDQTHKLLPKSLQRINNGLTQQARVTIHNQIRREEHDNVGIEASHKSELEAERLGATLKHSLQKGLGEHRRRQALKWKGNTYRAGSKLRMEKAAVAKQARRKTIIPSVRVPQIGKQIPRKIPLFAHVIERVKRTAYATTGGGKGALVFLAAVAGLVVALLACVGLFFTLGNSFGGLFGATTYFAADEDMIAAEAYYSGEESKLKHKLLDYQSEQYVCDEYIFVIEEIFHDPYDLISLISAKFPGKWYFSEVTDTLDEIFLLQYLISETLIVETRETTTTVVSLDPYTGEEICQEIVEEYLHTICLVTLENFTLEHAADKILNHAERARFAIFIITLGNRPDLFPLELYPYAAPSLERYYQNISEYADRQNNKTGY